MNIFKRLFKIGEAEANSTIDKMEDPIKLTEQGIRDLRSDLSKNTEALAQVKALSFRARNDEKNYQNEATEYEEKAIAILKNGQSNKLDASEADHLAKEALVKKQELENLAQRAKQEYERTNSSVAEIEKNIAKLKSTISQWESELRTLKSRVKVSKAKISLNKQMAEIDSHGTVTMLERMHEKVAQEESLAEAYGEIANDSTTIEDEIDKAADVSSSKADDQLEALKRKIEKEHN